MTMEMLCLGGMAGLAEAADAAGALTICALMCVAAGLGAVGLGRRSLILSLAGAIGLAGIAILLGPWNYVRAYVPTGEFDPDAQQWHSAGQALSFVWSVATVFAVIGLVKMIRRSPGVSVQ